MTNHNLREIELQDKLADLVDKHFPKNDTAAKGGEPSPGRGEAMVLVAEALTLFTQALEEAEAETAKYKDALTDMVWQFGYRHNGKGRKPASLFTGGLSALEHGFSVLDYTDPHPTPEGECAVKGCRKWATCGTPKGTRNGQYLSCCGEHMAMAQLGDTFDLKPDRLRQSERSE